jgi:hypothetical protein
MNTTLAPKIDRPCRMRWESLQGDEKRRFCDQCQLHVHNLSAMTAEEQMTLAKSQTSRICVRYQTHEGLRAVRWGAWISATRLLTWRNAAAAFIISGLGFVGIKISRGELPNPIAPTHQYPASGSIMGFGCEPLPWWKQLFNRFFK